MLKEFKAFAMQGNLVDIAVAFVMGAAFGRVITSFTDGIVAPVIGLLMGGVDFNKMKYVLKPAEIGADGKEIVAEVAVQYGAFIMATIDFIIVAFLMFLIVKAVNNMKKPAAGAPPPAKPEDVVLLEQIRDLLKSR